MRYPTHTPWGKPQTVCEIIPGAVVSVSTASHGGLGVDAAFADEHLSAACRSLGIDTGDDNVLWFEEDVDECAPLLELLDSAIYSDIVITQMRATADITARPRYNKECMKSICLRTLNHHHPSYIAAKTSTP